MRFLGALKTIGTKVVPPLLAVTSMAVMVMIVCVLWAGMIGPDYDAAYDDRQPMLITPSMDLRDAEYRAVGLAWRHLLTSSLQDVGWMPRAATPPARIAALTFDDGPYPMYTPWLLHILKQEQVPATFFLIGRDAEENPELVQQIVRDGHELANHSYSHRSMVHLTEPEIAEELRHNQAILERLTGVRTWLMRPPGGRITDDVLNACRLTTNTIVMWNDNPGDWQAYDADRIYNWVFKYLPEQPMLLLHSGRLGTLRAVPMIIAELRRRGYRFVTVSDYAKAQGTALPEGTAVSMASPSGQPAGTARR